MGRIEEEDESVVSGTGRGNVIGSHDRELRL